MIQVLGRHIVFGDLPRSDAAVIGAVRVFDALNNSRFKRLPFLQQIRLTLVQSLDVSRLPRRSGAAAGCRRFKFFSLSSFCFIP